MKKQIIFTKSISRLFAGLIDLTIFSVLTSPLSSFINKKLLILVFKDILNSNNIHDQESINRFFLNYNEWKPQEIETFLLYVFWASFVNYLLVAMCFFASSIIFGNSAGKYLFRMKIINEDLASPTTNVQYFKRALGYIFFPFSLFLMFFDKRSRGIHDYLAKTIVIKI